jgi:hypothetical protein
LQEGGDLAFSLWSVVVSELGWSIIPKHLEDEGPCASGPDFPDASIQPLAQTSFPYKTAHIKRATAEAGQLKVGGGTARRPVHQRVVAEWRLCRVDPWLPGSLTRFVETAHLCAEIVVAFHFLTAVGVGGTGSGIERANSIIRII